MGKIMYSVLLVAAALGLAHCGTTRTDKAPAPGKDLPRPDLYKAAYGPHERNVLDLWRTDSNRAPVLVFFHGGGFVGGDKWNIDPYLLRVCRNAGIAVASANYRYSTQQPFPGPMLDGARVIQYLRHRARELGIDPKRIAVAGSSAGAGIALWLAFHDDVADPHAADPVLRESSRVMGACVIGAQSSYDPRFIKTVVGGRAYEHRALPLLYGVKPEELDRPDLGALYAEASAITHVTSDDPPVIMYYAEPNTPLAPGPNITPNLFYPDFGKELSGFDKPGAGIHHPVFGMVLQQKMKEAGVECTVVLKGELGKKDAAREADLQFLQFLRKQFRIKGGLKVHGGLFLDVTL